jgi:lipopolysaccharide export system protein LptA
MNSHSGAHRAASARGVADRFYDLFGDGLALASAATLLAIVALADPAWAQGIDMTQGGPIQITARDGMEWRQAEHVVVANGDARAIRGGVTVTADRLFAWYRHRGDQAGVQPASAPGVAGEPDTEGNEVYRLRAEGDVHIFTATDQAWGDQATYDLDQGVLVMTGHALKLTTPNDTLTARDTLEYWSLKHMSVARGDAVVVTNDGRRISADTLVAYTVAAPGSPAESPAAGQAQTSTPPAAQRASPAQPGGDSMAAMAGKLERVEAFNNVVVRTQTDMVTGDRGVYVPDTGIARLGGHVRITRGLNQVNGSEAVVNLKTGISTLLAGNTGRVNGLIVPGDRSNPSPGDSTPAGPAQKSGRPENPP